jgi:hypothetical protein
MSGRLHEAMLNVSTDARLLYLLLWTVTDDHGRFRGDSDLLANALFPDDTGAQEKIPVNLQALEAAGYIRQKFGERGAFIAIRS